MPTNCFHLPVVLVLFEFGRLRVEKPAPIISVSVTAVYVARSHAKTGSELGRVSVTCQCLCISDKLETSACVSVIYGRQMTNLLVQIPLPVGSVDPSEITFPRDENVKQN